MILIRKGRVVDPVTGRDEVLDVLLDGNTICKTGKDLQAGEEILDAEGLVVAPGLMMPMCISGIRD